VSERALEADRAEDAAARRAAQRHFGGPFVLTAGAGTGKTTVLVARVLAWSLGPGWERAATASPERVAERVLERVVAITFTEAAAAEMATRILGAFEALARGGSVLGFDAEPPSAERAARAAALLVAVDHVRVETIHAFCRRLLGAYPLEAGLHPGFTVDARGAARATVVREVLEARVRAMAARGDADLEALLLEGVGAPELEEIVDALAAAAVPAVAFASDPLAPERVRSWVARVRQSAAALAAVAGDRFAALPASALARSVTESVAETLRACERDPSTAEALQALAGALRKAWTNKLLDRLSDWSRGKVIPSESAALGAERIGELSSAAAALLASVRGCSELDPAFLALLHRVLAPLLEQVEQQLTERGAESFDALLRRTAELLRRHPEVAAEIRRGIDQLLVDEFQDTDALQCEIVAMLAIEGAVRPGLFLVGDPKQSVYGWRSADIAAYLRFVERVRREPFAASHSLCVNHRSVAAVLEEVESAIAPVMREEAGVQPPFQRLYEAARSAPAAEPAVEYWCSERWDEQAGSLAKTSSAEATALEARHLAADLLRLRERGVAWSEVGVLLRSAGDLDEYLSALREAGVRYVVDRDRGYPLRREVLDAAALVRVVLDPDDQIALVATLRSAWVGVPDAAWRPLWARSLPAVARRAIEGDVAAQARVAAIGADVEREIAGLDVPGLAALSGWSASLAHAVEVLAELRRSFQEESADRFVESLRALPLVEATAAARHPGAFRVANLSRFLRELRALLEDHVGDDGAVLRALRRAASDEPEQYEGRPRDPDEDAVHVMTIHGAKGLDFEHVYVMQLHRGASGRERDFEHELRAGAVEWRAKAGRRAAATLGWAGVRERREIVRDAELVRTLYVALTRAKQRLVIAGLLGPTARRDSHGALLWDSRGAWLESARDRLLAARARGEGVCERTDGARRVVWLDLRELPSWTEPAPAAPDPGAVDRARAEADLLCALARHAARRAARPLLGRASEESADAHREARAEGGRDPGIAAAVGSAIHELLERFDWSGAAPEEAWPRAVEQLRSSLARRLGPGRLDAALERASALLASIRSGPLWRRLQDLAAHTLARELPLLARGDEEGGGAVGCVVGAIDWVHLDPATDEVVVVDFKTDRVDGEGSLSERVRHHRPQAERYREAARAALGLSQSPRVELWFLDAGRIEVVEPERELREA
jgi:ATP-dependent helicase/nuclease subunit A